MAPSVVVPFGPAVVNIVGIRAGDLNEMTLTLTSGGLPLDLTGQTLAAQARLKTTSAGAPALAAVITVVGNPVNGVATVRWPGDDVRTMLAGKASWAGVWDLQVDNGVDDPVTLAAGSFKAEMDVTRP
jgi:hypothetical protein